MKRPYALWGLIFWLLFLAFGGLAVLLDPSGGSLQMTDVLSLLSVPNYVLPGLFLLVVMGFTPLLLAYALLARPQWRWAWTATLLLSLILAVWLIAQGVLIDFQWPIQYVTAVNGLFILLLAMSPSVRKRYTAIRLEKPR